MTSQPTSGAAQPNKAGSRAYFLISATPPPPARPENMPAYRYALWLLVLALPLSAQAQQQSPLTVEQIMQEPAEWIGDWPENIRWGEQGAYLYFDWNPQGQFEADSLYRVPAEGGEPEKVPPSMRRPAMPFFTGWHHGEGVYDRGFNRKVYASGGDLYLYNRADGTQRRLTKTRLRESDPRFTPSGEGVVFAADDNLYRLTLASGLVEQLTDLRSGQEEEEKEADAQERFLEDQQRELFETLREEQEEEEAREAAEEREREAENPPPTFYTGKRRVQQLRLRPGGRYVTFALYAPPENAEDTKVLDYVTESGYAEVETARAKVGDVGAQQQLYVQDLQRDTTYAVDLTQLPGADEMPAFMEENRADADSAEAKRSLYAFGPFWSADGRYAVLDVRSRDNKDRWLARLDPETAELTVLDRQTDEAWIAGPGISWWGGGSAVGWMPDNRRFYFQSERSGYSHLYTVEVQTGAVEQLTEGEFEIFDPRLSQDGQTWFFRSSEASPHERYVYRMPADGGARTRLSSLGGVTEAAVAPGAETLGLLYSEANRPPEVYLQPIREGGTAEAVQVTNSPTEEWSAYDWRTGEIIRFAASDGAQVPAQIFRPEEPNGAAVLFVHGAGYLQNVHTWWPSYFREFMFHNLLADLGYTVMNVDFRASAGYGRDWRTAIYRHMGGRDLQDYVDAQRFLESEYGISGERTFIYGGSYGGFITLMALFTEEEHFGGGAALRSVTDWAHYNDPYTSNILNTPQTDSLAYARSSPIYFAEGLADPLLIAHGIMDTNVQFQDVVRLAQRLIELGKEDWELAVYPVEGHGFTEPASWTDEYRRILELIQASVGPERTAASSEPALEGETGER